MRVLITATDFECCAFWPCFFFTIAPHNLIYPLFGFLRVVLMTVYLIAVGAALWLGAHTAAWIFVGQVLCVASILPICLFLYQWVEDCRFSALQRKLDSESERLDENTPLVQMV